jgi:A/G-specific adenine glycosylase
MHKAAAQMDGRFPSDHTKIRQLPGVGDYTAGAIASIAFSQPFAAVDGNVLRVVARVTKDSGDTSSAITRQRITAAANRLLDVKRPGTFNQAMMELGATVCLPRNPQCLICPVAAACQAHRHGVQRELPVKLRRNNAIRTERVLLIVRRGSRMLFWKHPSDASKLAGFWELPEPEHVKGVTRGGMLGRFRHSITNHIYMFTVCEAFVKSRPEGLRWLQPRPLEYLYSTATRKALRVAGLTGF